MKSPRVLWTIAVITISVSVCASFGRADLASQEHITQDFVCPVSSTACASYQELVTAGDEAVIADVRYVCFRELSDQFFVVKLHDPLLYPWFWYKWNPKLAEYELKFDQQTAGLVQIQTFQNGVASDSTMPNMFVYGKWMATLGSLYYAANLRSVTAKEVPGSLTIDSSQIATSRTYEAQGGKRVTYSLTVQRSTKRFVEQFSVQNSPKEGFEYEGRCVEIKRLPTLPDPPPLTGDQQGQKEKLAYCSDSPEPEDKGYCASSFTYRDDYEEALKRKKTIKQQPATTKPHIP
jgi:hypothetical protein